MHLVSKSAQSIPLNGSVIRFDAGESIHTENSYKYTVEGFEELASSAGLKLEKTWFDSKRLFSVHFLSVG